MECSCKWGTVKTVRNFRGRQELTVLIDGNLEDAINYPEMVGVCQFGDEVLLNTTAKQLHLGTGGWHYVLAIYGRERSFFDEGHIMKLRYTPVQGKVLSVEEPASPYHEIMKTVNEIDGLPVAVGGLHSMLAPFVWTIKGSNETCKIVYLMSDGACLPIGFSKIVNLLKSRGLLHKTITFGHAFGGDFEAINVYSALLAAKHVAKADVVIITMGPGIVGTGTSWGTTAIEQGFFLNAISHLKGRPILIPRLSEGDSRVRHQGLSHHLKTILQFVVDFPITFPLPQMFKNHAEYKEQVAHLNQKISWENTRDAFSDLFFSGLPLSTMGRSLYEDELFFHGVVASALNTLRILRDGR